MGVPAALGVWRLRNSNNFWTEVQRDVLGRLVKLKTRTTEHRNEQIATIISLSS